MPPADRTQRGSTPREIARILRISKDRVRSMIEAGELGAVNTAPDRGGRPRYVIMPEHLTDFVRQRLVSPPPKPAPRRRRQPEMVDFFPD
jgi:excisionase family DNA binding protein